jgi:putative transposase
MGEELPPETDSRSALSWKGMEASRSFLSCGFRENPEEDTTHHSDRGVLYSSLRCQQGPRGRGMMCSMSPRANCHVNAAMESFLHTLKVEQAS